ncbi:DoxX family protein, partial [Candidatus Sumerlaeota bacterium]|nr:DoxX family protein [Candidatus Sumerlaeota bacterium]
MNKAKEVAWLLLRLASAFMFIQGGGMKLFDWFGGIPAEYGGHPAMGSMTWVAGVLEFYGGSLILI